VSGIEATGLVAPGAQRRQGSAADAGSTRQTSVPHAERAAISVERVAIRNIHSLLHERRQAQPANADPAQNDAADRMRGAAG
jgi:hypothetical protein